MIRVHVFIDNKPQNLFLSLGDTQKQTASYILVRLIFWIIRYLLTHPTIIHLELH